jgi:hypothetical protein
MDATWIPPVLVGLFGGAAIGGLTPLLLPSRTSRAGKVASAVVSLVLVDLLVGLRQMMPPLAMPPEWIAGVVVANVSFLAALLRWSRRAE